MQPLIQFCQRCQKSHPPGAHSARLPAPATAENEKQQRVTIREAVQMSGGKMPSLSDAILIDAAETQTAPKRVKKAKPVKKPAKAKKPKTGSGVTKPRASSRSVKAPQPQGRGKASSSSPAPMEPAKMTRAQLEAYVAADLARKAEARKAKAKAQAKWRGTLK